MVSINSLAAVRVCSSLNRRDATCLQSVEGMKVLCFELMEASGGRASASTLADLAASANELVVELTRRVCQVGHKQSS